MLAGQVRFPPPGGPGSGFGAGVMSDRQIIEITMTSRVEYVNLVHAATGEVCRILSLDEDTTMNLGLALHEATVNAIKHGNRLDPTKSVSVVFEIRPADWQSQEFFAFLREQNVGFSNLDQPRLSHCIGHTQIATSGVGYVRLHGRNAANWFQKSSKPWERYNYLYAEEELSEWVGRIRSVAEQTADVFVIANNHYRGKGPLAALMLLALLRGEKVATPPDLMAAYPQIAPLAIVQGPDQGRLF